MTPEPRRILLIRRKALGDSLLTVPAVLTVARRWPRAEIDLVMDRHFAALFADLAGRINVLPWPSPDGRNWLVHLLRTPYDLVIDWLGSPRTAFWSVLSGAKTRVGYDLSRRCWAYNVLVPRNRARDVGLSAYAGEAFLDPLRALGLDPGPWEATGSSLAEIGEEALGRRYVAWKRDWLATAAPRVVMVMSATWPAKAWTAAHIADVAGRLEGAGLTPLLVTGPGDESLAAELATRLDTSRFAPPTTLLELADLLRSADLFLGTDNGVHHLAVLLDLPSVTLFGPTAAFGWNPADPRHVALKHDVDCAPCDLMECPVAGHPCLEDLSPRLVAETVIELAGRTTT